MKATATILTIAAASMTASASVTSYTETFESGANNWVSGAFTPTTWNSTGSVDNSAYISSQLDLNSAGPFGLTLLRGQDDQNASGDAFVGNYLAGGITTVEFDFRHNAGVDLDIALRVATSANFPAFAVESSRLGRVDPPHLRSLLREPTPDHRRSTNPCSVQRGHGSGWQPANLRFPS